jgi:hypothetical protein
MSASNSSNINDQFSISNGFLPSPGLLSPLDINVINPALNQVKSQLQTFFASPNALEKLDQVFDITDSNAAHLLIENGAAGNFANIPYLQILPDTVMNGVQAAFSATKDTIYLGESLVQGDVLEVQNALIEELGHKFDVLLNPGGDTSGDEGELLKYAVLGLPVSEPELLRIQTEDDSGTVVVDNEVIPVEQSYNSLVKSSPGLTKNIGGWTNNNTYPRVSGDVNGDGKDDLIGFGSGKVYVSLSNGNGTFATPIGSTPSAGFTTNVGGWTNNNTYPRVSGDVNGDGKDDIIGFGGSQVFVSFSNGNGFGASIASTPSSTNSYTTNVGGWTDNNTYPRMSGDVNGDGKDDIIGFGSSKVFVSLSNGDGTFGVPIGSTPSSTNGFTTNVGGWTNNTTYPRLLGDVNGDGKDDIVGFSSSQVYVSLSKGDGTFNAPIGSTPSSTNGFTTNVGGWTDNNNNPRVLADVNGDNKDDIVGFGATNVFVSLSKGDGTFNAPTAYSLGLTKNSGGWTDNNNYPRVVGDVNKDGKDDLIGFGLSDVFVSLSGSSATEHPGYIYTDSDYLGSLYQDNIANAFSRKIHDGTSAFDSDDSAPDGVDRDNQLYAMVGGEVIEAKNGKEVSSKYWGYNGTVAIYNKNLDKSFIYWHLQEGSIDESMKGKTISPGSLIGREGNTGASHGSHTHVEVHNGRISINMSDPSKPQAPANSGRLDVASVFQDAVRRGLVKLYR